MDTLTLGEPQIKNTAEFHLNIDCFMCIMSVSVNMGTFMEIGVGQFLIKVARSYLLAANQEGVGAPKNLVY
jgi:hypothetical protein